MKKITYFLVSCLLSTTYTFAQVAPAASPAASFTQVVGVTKISVDYSRPALRGREVFGKMVPYDKVYRTGANASTRIETSADITVQGKTLKAGKYAIMSIPGTSSWTVIFSKDLNVSEQSYSQSNDVLRVTATPQAVPSVESFTIDISDVKDDGAALNISWEKTKVSLAIGVDNASAIEAALTQKNNDASGAFQQAAEYMVQKNQDLNKALTLVDKSLSLRENFRNNWIKAQILDKLGRPAEAVVFAQKAQSLGDGDGIYPFFKDSIEKGISDFKAKVPAPVVAPAVKGKKKKS